MGQLKAILKNKLGNTKIPQNAIAKELKISQQTLSNLKIHDSNFVDRLEPILGYFFPEAMNKIDKLYVVCPYCHRLAYRSNGPCLSCGHKFTFDDQGEVKPLSCRDGGGKHNFLKGSNFCTDCQREI